MIRMLTTERETASQQADDRGFPGAHTREAIARVVLAELQRVLPAGSRQRLAAQTSLAESGIDDLLLGDAVARIEGRYGMRFHQQWLAGLRTCGDLVDCVAERMFDAADRSPEASRLPSVGRADDRSVGRWTKT